MKEQWTKDIKNRMEGFEAETIPEGLWEGIEQGLDAMAAGTNSTGAQEDDNKKIVPLFTRARMASIAAAIIAIIGITSLIPLFLTNESDKMIADNTTTEKNTVSPSKEDNSEEPSLNESETDTDIEVSTESNPVQQIARHQVARVETNKIFVNDNDTTTSEEPTSAIVDEQLIASAVVSDDSHGDNNITENLTDSELKILHNRVNAMFDDYDEMPETTNRGISLAATVSGLTSLTSKSNPEYFANKNNGGSIPERNNNAGKTCHRPISIGLELEIPLSRRWSVNTGLIYSRLKNEADYRSSSFSAHLEAKQDLLGVPVKLKYDFTDSKKWNIYATAGLRVDFCVANNTHVKYNGRKFWLYGADKIKESPERLYFTTLSAGAQWNVKERLSLFIEPSLLYLLNESDVFENFYTEHPTNFNLQLGVRWKFNK